MPFKSKAQRRFFYAAEDRGELPKGTANRWEKHTKKKDLPERKRKKTVKKSTIKAARDLTTAGRKRIKTKNFALPGKAKTKGQKAESGNYPIPDKSHARAALSMVSRFGTAEEKAKVRAAVRRKFPDIGKEKKSFINGFVRTFLTKSGMTLDELTHSPVAAALIKVAAGPKPSADVQKVVDEAALQKARVDMTRNRLLTNVGTPFMAGALGGSALAQILRPSDVEVGNLQKKELLTHYDEEIKELKRRLAARR